MKELFRLLYLVLVILPLTVLLIGPLLALAALRGRQQIGTIVLHPGRRGTAGRVTALLLGLLAWLVVWGCLGLIVSQVALPSLSRLVSPDLQAIETPAMPVAGETPAMPVAAGPPTPTALPAAPTPVPATATPTPIPTPTPEPATPSPSPSPSPLPPTPTPVAPTATPTPMPPTSTPLPTPSPTSPPTPVATLTPEEAGQAIAAVEAANVLLRNAVTEPSIGNMADLGALWQGEALAKAQAFAQDLYGRYLRPLEVTFVYIMPPQASRGNAPNSAFVTSIERWTYTGPRSSHSESFQFAYTLRRQDDGWVIVQYGYGYAPDAPSPPSQGSPTPSLTPSTITATLVITPAGQ